MTNQELELKIKEIIKIENYFDMVVELSKFEKEYKQSDFYKITHQSLLDAVKNARIHYALQLDDLFNKIQEKVNTFDLSKLNELVDKFGDQLLSANVENQDLLAELKNSINEIKE